MAKKGSASTDKKAADKSDKKGKAKATTDDGEEKQAKVFYALVPLCSSQLNLDLE